MSHYLILLTLLGPRGALQRTLAAPDGMDVRLPMVCALAAQEAAGEIERTTLGGDQLRLVRFTCQPPSRYRRA